MKSVGILLAALLVLAADAPSTRAALRVPQVQVNGGVLQGYLNSVGESINVGTDQLDAQHWGAKVPNNSTLTIQIELYGNAAGNKLGLYNAADPAPALFQLFPGAATNGWFVVASFHAAPIRVLVSLFDNNAVLQGNTTYLGGNKNDFGFYLQGANGTFYSQDIRNPGHDPRVLAYAGTGVNSGSFWVALEDGPQASADHDFDDVILYVQGDLVPLATVPVAVVHSSWGMVKARFR